MEKATKKPLRETKPPVLEIKKETTQKKDITPPALELLFTVVSKAKGQFYVDYLEQFDINMQFLITGKASAISPIASSLGLEGKERDIVISVIKQDDIKKIFQNLNEKFDTVKNGRGIAFSFPISGMIGTTLYQFLINNKKRGKNGK